MSDRFYSPGPLGVGECLLAGPEAHHLAAVRRFAVGDSVVLFNGDGREYPAEVVSVGKKQVLLNVLSVESPDRELPFSLEVLAAMPKGDRGDFLVEKLTELGATRFTPLETTRTVVVPKDSRIERLKQAVVEASKQCGRNVLMRIDPTTRWPAALARPDLPTLRLLLATGTAAALRDALPPGPTATAVALAVGPEGGWEPSELGAARAAGWTAVGLGPRVLRVETAAIAATAWATLLER